MDLGIEHLEQYKNQINIGLHKTQSYIHDLKSGNSDLTFIAELFLEELLTEINRDKGYYFTNINFEKVNAPAIDLVDKKNRICYQVTATGSTGNINQKIKNTLTSFYKRNFDTEYDQLYILFASGISDKNKIKKNPQIKIEERSIEIKKKLFNDKHILELTDLFDIIFDDYKNKDLEKILNVIYKVPNRPEKKIIPFNFEKTYIERKVYDKSINQYPQLIDPVKRKRLNVLLGVGGSGKTTEVNSLASKMSKLDKYFCFKTRLINYANSLEKHLEAYCKNWRNVPQGFTTLLILDGLDEISNLKFDAVYREIKEFAILNPDINILVSCRTNFNPFYSDQKDSDQEDSDDGTFNELILQDINNSDIENYVKNECNSPNDFLQAIKQSKLVEILKNPFYLVNSINIFNSKRIIPKSKTLFFKELVEQRIEEEKKKNKTFSNNLDEFALKQSLKVLALTMQFSGEYKIEKIDFDRTIRNKETRENIKRIFFNENENYWQFEHNNFQEFLAAELISGLEWKRIKKIILLPNKKLKPKWLNAFSFLININEGKNNSISWFIENDAESLIKVKSEWIDLETRNKAFQKIFFKHKKEESIIWKKSYDEDDLVDFVKLDKNKNTIRFLIDEIDASDKNIQSVSNAIHLLKYIKNPNEFKFELQKKYLKLLVDKRNNEYSINYTILDSFSKWKFFNYEIKNKIIHFDSLFEKDSPSSSLCNYLENGKFNDITADLFLKIFKSIQNDHVLGSEFSLFRLIDSLTVDELSKLIFKLAPNKHTTYDELWMKDLYKKINSKAIKLFNNEYQLVKSIIDFIHSSFENHDKEYVKEFIRFFEKTNLVFTYFKKYLVNDLECSKQSFLLSALLANKECLDWLSNYYLEKKISDDLMWNFLYSLNIVENYAGHQYLREKLKKPTNGLFEPKPNLYEIFNHKKKELWFKVVLDQKIALKCIQKVFDSLDTENLTKDELKKQFNIEDEYKDIELVIGYDLIRRYSNDNINKDEFLIRFTKSKNWERFQLQEHLRFVKNKTLPQANNNWIKDWCYNNLHRIKFKNALTQKSDKNYSYYYNTLYFIMFAMYIDFKLPEKQLLLLTKLIGFGDYNRNVDNQTTEFRLYDFLKKNLNINILKNQILKNLKEGQLVELVLNAHIKVIEKEKWIEAKNSLIKYIINPQLKKHIRSDILRTYISFKGVSDNLIPTLETLTFKGDYTYFDWDFIDFMVKERNSASIEFLKKKIGNNEFDQLKLGIYLLKAQQTEAFDLIIKNLSLLENHRENEFFIRTLNKTPYNPFEYILFADFLIKTLNIYIYKDFNKSGYSNSLQILFNKLFEIITETEIDGDEIIKTISELLDSSEKNETSRRARYELYELENKFNIHKDKGCQISEAINELKKLGIEYEF